MNSKYTRDAFKSLELLEDKEFDLVGKDSFEELGDFIDEVDDVPAETEVIDLDAEDETELKDSYVGDVILSCPVCRANLFKTVDEVVIDKEVDLCCVGDACPICGQEDGFRIIGKVAPFEEKEEAEVEVEAEPEEDVEVEVKEKVQESKRKINKKRLQERLAKRITKNRLNETTTKKDKKVLNESKVTKKLNEEVPDIAYSIADEIDERFANAKFISWDDFNKAFEDACPILIDWTDDYFSDLETDVRGILSYKGWETIFEGEDEGGLRLVEAKVNEAVETRDVTDQVIVKTNEPGFISKMHKLRDQGYERIGSGNGQIIYAKPKTLKKEAKELTEAPIYDLSPQFDSRQSFYGKAKVNTGDKNDQNKLYSYDTLVAEIKDGKPIVYGVFSQTTLRHIKDFLKQNGFKADNAKQILADYGVKEECVDKTAIKESVLKHYRVTKKIKESKNRKLDLVKKLNEELKIFIDISSYEPWSGAVDTWEKIEDAGLVDELERLLEDIYPEGLGRTELNDILWFDADWVLESLGLAEEEEEEEEVEESLKTKNNPSLKEDIEKATIETEDQVIEVKSEEKEPVEEEAHSDEGMIVPLSDADIEEIETAQEEPTEEPADEVDTEEEVVKENPEDEEEFDFDEIQEESFKRITETYLKNTYSNIKSFEINSAELVENLLKLNGKIEFKSGRTKDTTFVFEKVDKTDSIAKNKARFVGLNETFTDKKNAYVLNVSLDKKSLIAESLRYNYPAKTKNLSESVKIVKGFVK